MFKTENLSKSFSSGGVLQHVLKNIDLELYRGDFTVIMGASGTGKSTLVYALSGMDTPSLGKSIFGDRVISAYSQDELAVFRREHCGFVFQQVYLLEGMSVMDNVLAAGLLVRTNLRRARGQAAAIVVLMLLAAMMLNLWIMLATDYRQNFGRCHDRLNAEHVTLSVDGGSEELRELLAETMEEDGRTDCFFLDDAMHMVGLFEYNGGEVNSWFVFLEKEAALSRPIGRVEIVEDSGFTSGIYMPVLYQSDSIDVGKTAKISIGSNEEEYTVCGFYNSAMAGSCNCGMCEIKLA